MGFIDSSMQSLIIINDGAELKETNYWDTEQAKDGFFYITPSSGCFRLLVPDNMVDLLQLEDLDKTKEVIISRGPWRGEGMHDAFQVVFEDGSKSPFILLLTPEQFMILPSKDDQDIKGNPPRWSFAIYNRSGRLASYPCRYRIVDGIPYGEPWQ